MKSLTLPLAAAATMLAAFCLPPQPALAATPTLGVGDCVGPKVTSSEQPRGKLAVFHGTPAPLLDGPGGRPTGRTIPVSDTYNVAEARNGYLRLIASTNSGGLPKGTPVGWVAAGTVVYFYGPHNCD